MLTDAMDTQMGDLGSKSDSSVVPPIATSNSAFISIVNSRIASILLSYDQVPLITAFSLLTTSGFAFRFASVLMVTP